MTPVVTYRCDFRHAVRITSGLKVIGKKRIRCSFLVCRRHLVWYMHIRLKYPHILWGSSKETNVLCTWTLAFKTKGFDILLTVLHTSFCFRHVWTLYNGLFSLCQCSCRYRYLSVLSLTYQHREVPGLAWARFLPLSRASRSVKCIRLEFHMWSPESVKMAMCAALRCVSTNFSAALPLLSRPAHIWTCQNSLKPNILRTLYTSSRLSGGKNFTELTGSHVLTLHLTFSFTVRTAAIPVCVLWSFQEL